MTCFGRVVLIGASSWGGAGRGVPAGGTGEAEAFAEQPRLVLGGGTPRRAAGRARRRRRWRRGRGRSPPVAGGSPTRPWPCHASSSPARSSGVPTNTAASERSGRPSSSSRWARRRCGLGRGVGQHDDEVAEDVQRLAGAADGAPRRCGCRRPSGPRRRDIAWGDEHDVGGAGRELERHLRVGEGDDQRLPLRRPGHDRGALHAEELALEVDVVELVAIDEAARRLVADDGVVLPAVPEPADDLDGVGRLGEQLGAGGGHRAVARVSAVFSGSVRRPTWAASATRCRDLRPPAGAAAAHVVERRDARRHVERLGVGGHHGGHQADVLGEGRHERGDRQGVEAAADLIGAVVGAGPASTTGGRTSPRW